MTKIMDILKWGPKVGRKRPLHRHTSPNHEWSFTPFPSMLNCKADKNTSSPEVQAVQPH